MRWLLVMLVWTVPVGFFLAGHWPFGLFVAVLYTLWVLISRRQTPPD